VSLLLWVSFLFWVSLSLLISFSFWVSVLFWISPFVILLWYVAPKKDNNNDFETNAYLFFRI
jgi:hypothetical protein